MTIWTAIGLGICAVLVGVFIWALESGRDDADGGGDYD